MRRESHPRRFLGRNRFRIGVLVYAGPHPYLEVQNAESGIRLLRPVFRIILPPLGFGAITCELRPIEIGVTNRNRTGTNAFTGRDAAVTS